MSHTIEPASPQGGEGFHVYEHGTYERSSVLAGQARRSFRGAYDTLEEALADFPNAAMLDRSTKPWEPEDASLEDLSGLPECPPDWFDPADAGEHWGDDY